ncbi:cytochrome P450 3A41-like isoform X2 [Eriocheir sinensis]|uniref:cytochrome P450 3A41-like isoform X2 n=1 Tax=Eriocheir sinensis TaxID=95602 RepID=UPI0021CADDF7|nr:cytochrome P450 3A41-like isoform X2 [Eriocheir sinensis]
MGVETWLLLATLAVLAWLYSRWRHSFWSSRGVPSPPALPFIGHFHKEYFIDAQGVEFIKENYKKHYHSMMFGMYDFFNPVLVIFDPDMIKNVMVRDFDHFTDLRDFHLKTGVERDEMVSEMLSLKNGADWKNLRAIMTPTFTSGKIKGMFPLVCDKADVLVKVLLKEASENTHVNVKKTFGRFTMDTIASCAFGIECNSLLDENAEFPRKADVFFTMSFTAMIKTMFFKFMPRLFKLLGLAINASETDFFIDVAKQTIKARQAGQRRGDFLDLLMEARENSDNPDSKLVMSDLCMVAQSVLFITAGYETTASLLAFSSFLLAKNKDQQDRLRDEVRQMVAEHGGVTYQGLMESKLLEACLQETLRIYPPAAVTERCCTKTYTLPGTDLTLKPGNIVEVPIWSLHHDSRYWPDPEAFIPDRFLPENKANIRPFTHLPFGMGPRNCIAMRFALMEAKVALAKVLLEAELEPAPGHEELVLESALGLLRSKDGVVVQVKAIKE